MAKKEWMRPPEFEYEDRNRNPPRYGALFVFVTVILFGVFVGGTLLLALNEDRKATRSFKQDCTDQGFRLVYLEGQILCLGEGDKVIAKRRE